MRFTDMEKIEICQMYHDGSSASSIAKKLGTHTSTICSILKRRGIEIRPTKNYIRKYSVNENYFDTIDSEDKAYFLGLLFADGYNSENRGYIRICLQEEDKHILDSFNKYLKNETPLTKRDLSKKHENWKDQWELIIRSKHMSEILANKYGCKQNKSKTLEFPVKIMEKELYRHFIRGYFDGDGSIRWRKPRKNWSPNAVVSIVGSEQFCIKAQAFIESNCELSMQLYHNKKTTMVDLQVCGNNKVKQFMNWIYHNSSLCIKRKKDKFEQLELLTTEDIRRANILTTRNISGLQRNN